MILLHTTLYKPYSEILRVGPRPARPGARDGRNSALCGPWRRFPGSVAPYPYPARFLASCAFLRSLVVVPGACLVRNGDAGQLGRSVLALSLGVQPAAFPLALSFDQGHGLGKPFFPAKPLFAAFQPSRCWTWAGWWSWHRRGVPRLGKPPGRRPARLPEGEPVKPGEPRRGAPPKAQAGAEGDGAEREARRVGAPVGRCGGSVCRCRSSCPPIGEANYQANIYR